MGKFKTIFKQLFPMQCSKINRQRKIFENFEMVWDINLEVFCRFWWVGQYLMFSSMPVYGKIIFINKRLRQLILSLPYICLSLFATIYHHHITICNYMLLFMTTIEHYVIICYYLFPPHHHLPLSANIYHHHKSLFVIICY